MPRAAAVVAPGEHMLRRGEKYRQTGRCGLRFHDSLPWCCRKLFNLSGNTNLCASWSLVSPCAKQSGRRPHPCSVPSQFSRSVARWPFASFHAPGFGPFVGFPGQRRSSPFTGVRVASDAPAFSVARAVASSAPKKRGRRSGPAYLRKYVAPWSRRALRIKPRATARNSPYPISPK
jgi:hypothetical protein